MQRKRVEKYGDEQGLEEAFIQPVLRALGWKLKYQTFLQGREPDYALFLDDADLDHALQADRKSPAFWNFPALLADAKAWHVNLDLRETASGRREYPPEQIEWYLDRSRLDFAILANGQLWRLIPREYGPQQRRFQTYLEFNLPLFLEEHFGKPRGRGAVWLADDFFHFFLFFGPAAYRATDGRKPLIRRALEGSSEYRLGVGEGLKERTFEALRLCIGGFLNFRPNALHPSFDLEYCRDQSFILLYRLLFILFAEDRRLLPYRLNRPYTNNRSLSRHRDEIASRLDRVVDGRDEDYSKDATALWADLADLFDLVNRGHRSYDVPEYNGGLFDPEAHPFLAEKRLPDWYLARVIDQLGRAADPQQPAAGLFRVDYHDLAIQHLGSIYEGLLELRPRWANERMVVVSRKVKGRVEERYLRESEPVPSGFARPDVEYPPQSIYLETDKGERRETGSYYTPDHIVNYIVQNTLGPLCRSVSEQLQLAIKQARQQGQTAEVERLERDFGRRVLELRVLDPAMGSGHYLLRACQYLAEEIATSPYAGEPAAAPGSGDEGTLAYWKRQVVEQCLYGVDLNGLAVELAKLALWLETVAANQPLSFLDHHLRHGNSLIGARVDRLGALPGAAPLQAGAFAGLVRERLPELLELLHAIRRQPSETARQVKDKERLFRRFEQAREPFRLLADLHCSVYAEGDRPILTDEQYRGAADRVGNPRKFKGFSSEKWFQDALERARRPDMHCFSWELESPEVFFVGPERHPNPGFDAVIGNPPYDVLSELETGSDLSPLRAAIDDDPVYEPSVCGKNNLYKLFVCKALDLLAEGGYLGFITPMAVLGDEQAALVRRQLVRVGRFTSIEAFPQKDDPKNRVFPEAKLSTAVFILVKDQSPGSDERAFRARVHPGRLIEEDSPGLNLTTAAIPLYDPSNFTIVSCDQADWDLAVRIMSSERMGRLKQFAEFFQGEVNETNERKRGTLTHDLKRGKLVTRGASICLYVLRPASQGDDLLLDVDRFLRDKGPDTKAFHFRYPRVGLQESSPQNNFRRIIAALVPKDEFCNHTVNYCSENKCSVDLHFVLALLNSKLADWYFRLGSTNAHVSHYQLYNLPCPIFTDTVSAVDEKMKTEALQALDARTTEQVVAILGPRLVQPPFSLALRAVIIEAVKRIAALEADRGEIARVERSALAPAAQPYQDLIDRLLYAMAGLSEVESSKLEERLAAML